MLSFELPTLNYTKSNFLVVQSTEGVRSSNGTTWAYRDCPSNAYSASESLDYKDLTATDTSRYWISMISVGRVVARLPLAQLAGRTTVNYRYTAGTNAVFSHTTSRRSGSKPREWVAGGYTLTTDGSGNNIMVPHYIRFSL